MNNYEMLAIPMGRGMSYAEAVTFDKRDLVRCEDCKHMSYMEGAPIEWCCLLTDDAVMADHFCSHGERCKIKEAADD